MKEISKSPKSDALFNACDTNGLFKLAVQLERENEALRKDAERFNYLQNIDVVKAQAFFWTYSSRKQRAAVIDAAIKEQSNG